MNENESTVIDNIFPVSTKIISDGGIDIWWTNNESNGEVVIYWGSDGKLHADTEFRNRDFLKTI